MRSLCIAFVSGLLVFTGCVHELQAQEANTEQLYAREQALVAQLSASPNFADQRQLADMLREGLIASADNPLRRSDRAGAVSAYRRAIELGDPSEASVVALGRLLLREEDSAFAEVLPALQGFALAGNGDAAYLLALDGGQNRKEPIEQVTQRLRAAAVMGSDAAVLDLAAAGIGVGDAAKKPVLEKLRLRATEGSGPSAYSMYQIYENGQLVQRDEAQALTWLRKAADAGHVNAMKVYAEHMFLGRGMPADPAKAAALYRRAALHGSAAAALVLGRHAVSGSAMGIPLDEGRTWLRRAAEIGIRGASIELSNLDFKEALTFTGDETERSRRLEAALVPIAQDPEALTGLADRYWNSSDARIVAPMLLPLLEQQALAGNTAVGLAYNAWLQRNGQPLPEKIARALVDSLRKNPLGSTGFSNFTIANLALDQRIPESVITTSDAINLLFKAADADVGQAMLRLGQLYVQGDRLAHSPTFAKRWLLRAQGRAVERAFWELASLQGMADDPAERKQAEQFYLRQLDNGDPRAALALVRHKLRWGGLDAVTLAQARSALTEPGDEIDLAAILISSGVETIVGQGKDLLRGLQGQPLDPETMVSYGRLRMLIAASPAEAAEALEVLKTAADSGAITPRIALASTYLSSTVYADKRKTAVDMLADVLAVNPDDPEARLLMSKAYLMGFGVERDARKAEELTATVRAEGGYDRPKATMLEADWLAFSSSGRDPSGAVALLKAQASRGSVAAERALGEAYLSGFGLSIQPDMAASRLYRAANSGDKDAMAGLGHLLLNGYGVTQSRSEGLTWLARAAEAGNTAAMYELSHVYALGRTGESAPKEAVFWLRRAAERNHPNAAYQLGVAYLKGEWVTADVGQATVWLERSALSGSLLAARTLKMVREHPTDLNVEALEGAED